MRTKVDKGTRKKYLPLCQPAVRLVVLVAETFSDADDPDDVSAEFDVVFALEWDGGEGFELFTLAEVRSEMTYPVLRLYPAPWPAEEEERRLAGIRKAMCEEAERNFRLRQQSRAPAPVSVSATVADTTTK